MRLRAFECVFVQVGTKGQEQFRRIVRMRLFSEANKEENTMVYFGIINVRAELYHRHCINLEQVN